MQKRNRNDDVTMRSDTFFAAIATRMLCQNNAQTENAKAENAT